MKYYYPKCPKCGAQFHNSDCAVYNQQDETDRYVETMCGICPKCGRNISWRAIYSFSCISNLKADE